MATEASVMGIIRASRPSFRNAHDKVAFSVHATFLASGYALVATGRAALSDPIHAGGEEEVGVEGWDEFEDSYGFVYVKERCRVIVKCVVIEDVLAVDVAKIGDDLQEPFHVQINVKDHVADSSGGGNYRDMYKNFADLVNSLKLGLLDKVEPKPSKGGSSSSSVAGGHGNVVDGLVDPVGVHAEPQPHSLGLVYPPVAPSGFSDLDPGIGAGVFPERTRFGGGDMLVGPNDPRWFGGMGEDFRRPGNLGGIPGVPPGARFDPYGPPGVPGFEPGRFVRPPQRPGGGVHPDLPHFQGPDYI